MRTIESCTFVGTWLLLVALVAIPATCLGFATISSDEFGVGARDEGMGMAYTAIADDYSAVYYNPAGLDTGGSQLSLNFGSKFYGRLFSVPHENSEARGTLPTIGVNYARSYSLANDTWHMPAFGFASVFFPPDLHRQSDDNNPHSIRYNSEALLPIYSGIGYRLTPYLSVGAGLGLGFSANFQSNVLTAGTVVTPQFKGLELVGPLSLSATPHFGLMLGPFRNWKVGLAYRGSQTTKLKASFTAVSPGPVALPPPLGLPSAQNFPTASGWSPQQVAGGVAYGGLSGWLFSSDLVFKKWDEWISSSGHHPHPGFRNRLSPRFGVEHVLDELASVQAGYYFEPTPVPNQDGNTSYVDNDQHVFSLGLTCSLARVLPVRATLGAVMQAHWLLSRTTHKSDPTNSFYPGYTVSGAMLDGGLMFSIYP